MISGVHRFLTSATHLIGAEQSLVQNSHQMLTAVRSSVLEIADSATSSFKSANTHIFTAAMGAKRESEIELACLC